MEWESVPKEERKTWLTAKVKRPTDKRIFYVKMAFDFGMSVEEIFDICKIDPWFLYQFEELYQLENKFRKEGKAIIEEMKRSGFSNRQLAFLSKEEQILAQVRSGAAIEITKAKVEKTLREEEELIEKYLEEKTSIQFIRELILALVNSKHLRLICILLMTKRMKLMSLRKRK